MTLPAFAAERRAAAPLLLAAGRAAIDRCLLPAGRTAANPRQRSAAGELWDRRTDGRTTVTWTLLRVLPYASSVNNRMRS